MAPGLPNVVQCPSIRRASRPGGLESERPAGAVLTTGTAYASVDEPLTVTAPYRSSSSARSTAAGCWRSVSG